MDSALYKYYNTIQLDVKTAFLYGDLDEELYATIRRFLEVQFVAWVVSSKTFPRSRLISQKVGILLCITTFELSRSVSNLCIFFN